MLARPFWLALGFLTTLPTPPIGKVAPGEMRRASAFYPLIGWIIGGLLVSAAWLFANLPTGLAAGLVLALWLGVTGMLHLDGLLDSADALLAMRPAPERLRILGDVHHGSFAFGVGFAFLLLKWQAIGLSGWLALLLAPVVARFWLLPLLNLFPAARPEGLGATARQGRWELGLLFALPALVLAPLAFLVTGAWALLVGYWASRRLGGGLSGDVYGAIIETSELAFLLALLFQAAPKP